MANPILLQNTYWIVTAPDGTEGFLLASPNRAPDVPAGYTARLATFQEVAEGGGLPPEESPAGWSFPSIGGEIGATVGATLAAAVGPVLASLFPLLLLAGAVLVAPKVMARGNPGRKQPLHFPSDRAQRAYQAGKENGRMGVMYTVLPRSMSSLRKWFTRGYLEGRAQAGVPKVMEKRNPKEI